MQQYSLGHLPGLFYFYLLTNQTYMKPQQIIDEVRLVYRTKVKASDRLQVKCSKDAFDIFMENWDHDSIVTIKLFNFPFISSEG